MEHWLPIIICCLSFWAALVYAFKGMWFPALYWFSAFTLNFSVIAMAGGVIRGT